MTSPRRCAALLSAILVFPLALSACGGDGGVPSDAVVKIGSDTISKTALDHYIETSAKSQAPQGGVAVVPDPPNYAKCIVQKKRTASKPAKGQPAPTEATFKAQCRQQYAQLRDQAMQFLISSAWTEGESADRGVKISDADLKRDFDRQRVKSFPKDADYLKFLKQTGFGQEDLLYRIKVQKLNDMLHAKVLEGSDKVSAAQVANYYNKNKSKFAVPGKRDFRVVLTKTQAKAEQAKAALDGGQSWKVVASKFSLDQGTRDQGGLLTAVTKGRMVKPLEDALAAARKGEVSGPVKTPSGYIVFEVEKVTADHQQSLKQAAASIKQQLVTQQQQTKLAAFQRDLEKKWKARTECQKGYAMQSCKNAPKLKPTTAAPSGTATTGAGAGAASTNN